MPMHQKLCAGVGGGGGGGHRAGPGGVGWGGVGRGGRGGAVSGEKKHVSSHHQKKKKLGTRASEGVPHHRTSRAR